MTDRRSTNAATKPEYPTATIREIALALFVADALLTDFEVAEDALRWARPRFDGLDSDPTWGEGRHAGDCTRQPMTCSRCLVEEYEQRARTRAIKEGFDV